MSNWAWLDGVFLAADQARISPFDRGFLFADSVYEVTAVYDGRPIDMERHLARLDRSLKELGFSHQPDPAAIKDVHAELIARNQLAEGLIYLQITRGAYGRRDFVAPGGAALRPTMFAFAEAKPIIDTAAARDGVAVVTVDDIRWGRRDIKTTQLLASVLAKTEARSRGAADAWMVGPDGLVTEGASSNAWIARRNGEVVTRALSNDILAGVTRNTMMDEATAEGAVVLEQSFSVEEAKNAAEAWISGAGGLIVPVVELDGAKIGDGRPGPIVRGFQRRYFAAIGVDVAAAAPWALQLGRTG
ncbi:D-alanine aminotransferase [bacterium]|nr:D-alanine aminotransferase [bacterium]